MRNAAALKKRPLVRRVRARSATTFRMMRKVAKCSVVFEVVYAVERLFVESDRGTKDWVKRRQHGGDIRLAIVFL